MSQEEKRFDTQGDLAFKAVLETALNEGVAACFNKCYVPPTTNRRVAIIGAGIAGLVAAKQLLDVGTFDVQLYERTERVGGRTYTLRGFSDELYGEGGAMRIPKTHYLTHGIISALSGSSKAASSNQNREEKEEKSSSGGSVKLLEFYQRPRAFVIEGKTFIDDGKLVEKLAAEFNINKVIVDHAVNEHYFKIAKCNAEGAPSQLVAWQRIFEDMDGYSVRTYYTHKLKKDGFNEEDIANFLWLYNVVNTTESLLETDVIELFKEYAGGWWEPEELTQIKGGTDVLATEYAKAYDLNKHIKFGLHVVEIAKDQLGKYSIVYHNQAELKRTDAGFDDVIITVPFTCLRLIDIDAIQMDTTTKQAIRTLQYLASTKVLLQFRERFWTNLTAGEYKFGSVDWGSIKTDLPIRNIYAPNPAMYNSTTKRGVLLASYTWGLDGIELASMKDVDLIQQALKNVKEVFTSLGYDAKHGDIDELFEQGRIQRWGQTEWTGGGAFCFVAPGQYTSFYDKIVSPQDGNKVILAGEHASNSHGWIQGAIESGLRAAIQIFQEEYQVPEKERWAFTFGKEQFKKVPTFIKKFATASAKTIVPKPTSELILQ